MSPACFPPTVLLLDASLPSAGSSRSSSPTSTVLSTRYDFLPPIPPHFVAFAWRYHGNTRNFAPHAAECCDVGPGVGHPVTPTGISSTETTGSPTFLGNPMRLCPALRPRQDRRVRPLRHAHAAPALTTTKAPALHFRGSITQLQHWLSTLRSMGYPMTTQDSLPAAGQALPDGLSTRRVPTKGFKLTSCSSSSSSKLSWRKVRPVVGIKGL